MNTTSTIAADPSVAVPPAVTHGLAGRLLAIVLVLAVPTGFLAWVLGFDTIKTQVNGRIWCASADDFALDVKVQSSGSRQNITDTLLCQKGGAVTRTVGDVQMMATNIGVGFGISLLLFALLVGAIVTYANVRRRLGIGQHGGSRPVA